MSTDIAPAAETSDLPFRFTTTFRVWWVERFEKTDFAWLAAEFDRSAVRVAAPPVRTPKGRTVYHTPEFPEVYLYTVRDSGLRVVTGAAWHEPEPGPAPADAPAEPFRWAELDLPETAEPPDGMAGAELAAWASRRLAQMAQAENRARRLDRRRLAATRPLLAAREADLAALVARGKAERKAETAANVAAEAEGVRRRWKNWNQERGRVRAYLEILADTQADPAAKAALEAAVADIDRLRHRPAKDRLPPEEGGAA